MAAAFERAVVANLPHHAWTLTDAEIYAALVPLAAEVAVAEEATDGTVGAGGHDSTEGAAICRDLSRQSAAVLEEPSELAARTAFQAVRAEGFSKDAPVVEYVAGCIKRERERIAAVMEHQHMDPGLIAGILGEDEDPAEFRRTPRTPAEPAGAAPSPHVTSAHGKQIL